MCYVFIIDPFKEYNFTIMAETEIGFGPMSNVTCKTKESSKCFRLRSTWGQFSHLSSLISFTGAVAQWYNQRTTVLRFAGSILAPVIDESVISKKNWPYLVLTVTRPNFFRRTRFCNHWVFDFGPPENIRYIALKVLSDIYTLLLYFTNDQDSSCNRCKFKIIMEIVFE